MTETKIEEKKNVIKYTAGFGVESSPDREHMTIFATASKPTTEYLLILLRNDLKEFPRSAQIIGETMLGPEKNIPVWLVHVDKGRDRILKLWEGFNVEEEHTKNLNWPLLHITKKGKAPPRKIGDTIKFSHFFMKEIGPHDPFFVLGLD
jgi:hypothetical protein